MSMFDIAYSGLQAANMGMLVSSMNANNLLTPGYTRQGIVQSAIGPMGEAGLSPGNGVQVNSIRRLSSQYLVNQVWQTNTKAAYFSMGNEYVSSLEKVIGTDSTSLGNGLDDFFSALNALTQQPESQALRQQLLNQANTLSTRFNSMNDFISSQKESINTQRGAMVEQINTLSGNIAEYNKKIAAMESTGGNSSVLRDQRDELVKTLSSMADVKVTDDSNGYTVSLSNGQPLVSGKTAGKLSTGKDSNGNTTLTLAFSTSEFSLNPSTGGQLGALYDYETGTLKQMGDSVQGMAQAVADMFNTQLAQGYDLNGKQGKPLFTFDASNPAGMLQVNDLAPDELALSGDPKEPGNGDNLNALLELKNQKADIPGMGNMSLNEGAAAIISTIGIASKQSKTEMDAAVAVRDDAQKQRDDLSGVNQDREAMNLQAYMQAYQASMKVISTGNQVFSDLLSMF
ncbi:MULTISPECIES: flagellar hook-associated protein FlgK [Enterobacter cloacae complex]|uniref:Flagellar hook-associated protein 1 n=1 Tax=Enterobacter cloacae TaxID=550 RepID=A0A7H8UDW4_ENTCL|nr:MULTISPECIES: flagellar hook-associated protein FlgK [Enterobacter cloacae complex]MDE4081003.1 flagellar hook-associated protein FlgK [Enterobacter pasteurii]QKZ96967.1 flagellar hook-associated protein FlgK [Enterobacter cloacae]